MKLGVCLFVVALSATTLSSAIPKPDEETHKNRVIDKELSNQEHFGEEEHHNSEYDHEAFLGKEEAKTFDELSPEESKQRLGKIFAKIDKDQDGEVTEEELREWIKHVQNRYILEDTERQWEEHDPEDGKLVWDSYMKRTYGFDENEDVKEDEEDDYNFKDMIDRDKVRWDAADLDKDGKLSQEEFANFLHPEEADHMRGIVVQETLADIDKDKDGKISLEEYIGDMYDLEEGEGEPEWVRVERQQFTEARDLNKDGFMDKDEVQKWILPDDFDHIKAESEHLIREADKNKDGKLDLYEVLEKYDLFVGSQATDFGEYLTRHDEF